MAMQRNSFKTFREISRDSVVIDVTNTRSSNDSESKAKYLMLHPFWLTPGYIATEHFQAASFKIEGGHTDNSDGAHGSWEMSQTTEDNESRNNFDQVTSNHTSQSSSKQKANNTGPLTRNKIANEAASILYRLITAVLSKSRNAGKIQIFHYPTYLTVSWSHHGCQVDPKSLKNQPEAPMTGAINNIDGLA